MKTIDWVEKYIFELPLWKLIVVIGLLIFFKVGIWYIPNIGASHAIAQNPFANPFQNPNEHYLFWNWLGPFLAWLIGATGQWQFFLLHLLFSIAFTFLFIIVAIRNFNNNLARISIILFTILPVSGTAYFWVSTDSVTLFLMMLALAFPNSIIMPLTIGILLGAQHFEQGFFAVAGLLAAVLLNKGQGYSVKYTPKFCFLLLIGIVLGKILLFFIFKHYAINVASGRIGWLKEHIYILLNQFFFHFQYILWSIFGLGWLLALKFADWGRKSLPFFLVLSGLCLLLPIAGDQTRVLAVVTFPLVSVYWLLNQDFIEKVARRETAMIFILWVLMPWGWVWGGVPRWSVFPYDIAYITHMLFGWFNVPENPATWPF